MSSKIQPAPPEEYVPMVKVTRLSQRSSVQCQFFTGLTSLALAHCLNSSSLNDLFTTSSTSTLLISPCVGNVRILIPISHYYKSTNVFSTELCHCVFQDVGLALRTLLATVDETLPQLPASTHREVMTHTRHHFMLPRVLKTRICTRFGWNRYLMLRFFFFPPNRLRWRRNFWTQTWRSWLGRWS